MRYLLAAIIAATLGWAGYWYFGATQTERALRGWFDDRSEEGWVANYSDISTIGFPNRLDSTISDPELADPATGLAWRAPFLQFLSLSYKPHHIIAVWPQTQTLGTPQETITILSDGMKGSLFFEPSTNLAIDRVTIETGPLRVSSSADWDVEAQSGQIALRQTPASPLSYDLSLEMVDMDPPDSWTSLVKKAGLPTDALARADLDVSMKFDRPWDLDAIEVARPQPRQVEIGRARITWGDLVLDARGKVSVDNKGRLDGEITVRATNWRAMLDLAVESGALNKDLANLANSGLGLLARMSGNDRSIDAPLTFRKGSMTLGGLVPLGPAPVLIIR